LPDLSQRLQEALTDRCRIERTLGRGGMATVFLAEDLKHHRRVAIKVLDPEVAAALSPERFLREIETDDSEVRCSGQSRRLLRSCTGVGSSG
jgi:serine/threonine protein kinase